MMTEAPAYSWSIDITKRDVICFAIALAVHSLLFLWKGGLLKSVGQSTQALGDMIVQVGYLSENPGGGYPGTDERPGSGSGNLLSRVKSFFSLPAPAPQAKTGGDLAVGVASQQLESKPNWTKTEQALNNKNFIQQKDFKQSALDSSMGVSNGDAQQQSLSAPSAQGNFKTAGTALKEKSFQTGLKDSPFKVVQPKSIDTLSNINAIPVSVEGDKNQSGSASVVGSDSVGPSMKSKELSSGGMGSRGGFGGSGGTRSSGGGKDGAGMLAMGGGGGHGDGPMAIGGTGGQGAGGTGTDTESYGDGHGSGYGGGGGTGVGGFGTGTGSKSWGGGTGIGATRMESLPRKDVVPSEPAGKKSASSGDKDFIITGALAGRGIMTKVKPKYENGFDGRVALKFAVDYSGRVLDGIVVVLSSGNPTFDQKVIASLKQWVFVPLDNGRTNEIQEGVITFIFRGV